MKIKVCLLFFFIMVLSPINVLAVTFDNDGLERSNPYGDSKLESSYEGTSYVDCYIPYKLTPKDIGGYALSATQAGMVVTQGGGCAMPDSIINEPVAVEVMKEAPYSYAVRNNWALVRYSNPSGFPVTTESGTGLNIITDNNGNQYYMTAVQPFFFKHDKKGTDGFPSDESGGFGEIVDVILTDGTCIHFVCFDINAAQHTNGVDYSGEAHFDFVYDNCDLKMKQYNNLFSTQNGNTLEIWGDPDTITTAFKEKYNIGKGDDKNKIAYYRMYNKYLKDSPQRRSGVGKEVSFSYGSVTISSSSDSNGFSSYMESLVPENELEGMPQEELLNESQNSVSLPSASDMTAVERTTISDIRNSVKLSKQEKILSLLLIFIVFIGLLMVLYAILLLLAYAFDRSNVFFGVSLVSIITFGRIVSPDDEYIPFIKILKVFALFSIIGFFLVSMGAFSVISKFLIWVSGLLKNL